MFLSESESELDELHSDIDSEGDPGSLDEDYDPRSTQ